MKKIITYLAVAITLIFQCISIGSFAQPLSLDLTFSSDGMTTTAIGTYDYGRSAAIQSDGKILLAGYSSGSVTNYNIVVVRYNTNGTLDNTFGSGGIVSTDIGSTTQDYGNAIAIQSDGKIVVAGTTYSGTSYDFVVVRYNTNGTLDPTFDTDGKVTTFISANEDNAFSIALQSDGKILAGGLTDNGTYNDIAIVRYNTDGSIDNTFGTSGIVITDIATFDDYAAGIAVQPGDGKIVITGSAFNGANDDIYAARYNTNGTLDNTFGTAGKVVTTIGSNGDYVRSIALQSDGKIVVGGGYYSGTNYDFAVVRYNTNGTLDTGFDSDGKVTTTVGTADDYGIGVAIQSDGKIVLAGYCTVSGNLDFGVVRYNTNGSLDTGFDSDGKLTSDITGAGADDIARSVVIQPSDGKIVVTGYIGFGTSTYNFAAARYCPKAAQPGTISGSAAVCNGTTQTYSITAVAGADDYTWTVPSGATINSGQGTTSISVTFGSTSGSVTVTADNGCGVSPVQTKSVVVTNIPATPGTVSGSAAICEGTIQTYNITSVSGATSYTWTVPAGSVINSGQGTNSISVTIGNTSGNISVTADNSCGNSNANVLSITVTPLPNAFFAWSSTGLAVTFTNLSSNGTTYSWLFGDAGTSAAPNPVHNYVTAGTYTVELTVTNACGSSYYTTNITITTTGNGGDVGIEETENSIDLIVYPNPTNGKFKITIGDRTIQNHQKYTIEIFNLFGQIVHQLEIENQDSEIDLSGFSNGIYYVKCISETGKGMVKIVKE